VLVDGGIRRGTDVVKAKALGAGAVLVGRPFLWGLALGGEAGVRAVFDHLHGELDLALALCGKRCLADRRRFADLAADVVRRTRGTRCYGASMCPLLCIALGVLSGCMHEVHRPGCSQPTITELADDEESPLGITANDLLAIATPGGRALPRT
jgi:hypothetical protein